MRCCTVYKNNNATAQRQRRCAVRRCPFHAEIVGRVTASFTPSVLIIASEPSAHRWTRALVRRAVVGTGSTTLLPPGTRPGEFKWPPIPLVADVTGLGGDELHELAEALVRDGCELAFLVDQKDPSRTVRLIAEG